MPSISKTNNRRRAKAERQRRPSVIRFKPIAWPARPISGAAREKRLSQETVDRIARGIVKFVGIPPSDQSAA